MKTNTTSDSNNLPWVVVAHAGTSEQRIVHEAPTFSAALLYWQGLRDASADVMKRRPDGQLTTEY